MKRLILPKTTLIVISAFLTLQGAIKDESSPDSIRSNTVSMMNKNTRQAVLEFGEGNIESLKLADNGLPNSIWGDLNKGITASDNLEKCYQFFELHKVLLGLIDPRQEINFRVKVRNTFRFDQYYKGIKTEGSHAIHFDFKGGGNIVGYTGSPNPEAREVDFSYKISAAQAMNIAINHCQSLHPNDQFSSTNEPELQIKRFGKEYKLIWKTVVDRGHYHVPFYFCYVDAHSGEIVHLAETTRKTR
jgi:hypothetical protein